MAIDVETFAAINSSPLPYDLFREVHKGLRRAIFGVIEQAGCADYTDIAQRQAVRDQTTRLLGLLEAHHRHEDVYVRPLLEQHATVIAAMVVEAHAELAGTMNDIARQVDALADLGGSDAIVKGLHLYRTLAGFAAVYLAHMAFEEGPVMSALRDAMNIGDLYSVHLSIRTALAPDELCEFFSDMAPAMSRDERVALLIGLKAAAAPAFFEQVRATLEQVLDPAEYRAVAARAAVI